MPLDLCFGHTSVGRLVSIGHDEEQVSVGDDQAVRMTRGRRSTPSDTCSYEHEAADRSTNFRQKLRESHKRGRLVSIIV